MAAKKSSSKFKSWFSNIWTRKIVEHTADDYYTNGEDDLYPEYIEYLNDSSVTT